MNYIPQTNKWELYPPVQSACTFVAIDVFIKFNHLLYYPLFLTLTPRPLNQRWPLTSTQGQTY